MISKDGCCGILESYSNKHGLEVNDMEKADNDTVNFDEWESISAEALTVMDKSVVNLKAGIVSPEIDLTHRTQ